MSLEYFPYLAPVLERMRWHATEVVKEIGGRPTLCIRVHLEGPSFPHRALEPIIRIGARTADHVDVDVHGRWARGYFREPPESRHLVEFGFDDGILYRFPGEFHVEQRTRLDRARLDRDIDIRFD